MPEGSDAERPAGWNIPAALCGQKPREGGWCHALIAKQIKSVDEARFVLALSPFLSRVDADLASRSRENNRLLRSHPPSLPAAFKGEYNEGQLLAVLFGILGL